MVRISIGSMLIELVKIALKSKIFVKLYTKANLERLLILMLKLNTSNDSSHPISGVIFDLDGTLVASNLNFSAIKSYLSCPPNIDLLDFVSCLPEEDQRVASEYIQKQELDDALNSAWLPWAKKFVENLKCLEVPMAIVTRNFSQAASIKVNSNNIPIQKVITREDAPPKPNPKALLDISNEWALKPSEILYVGDYLYDIQAANNANMHSCLYSPSGIPDYAHLASITVKCFSELWGHLSEDVPLVQF